MSCQSCYTSCGVMALIRKCPECGSLDLKNIGRSREIICNMCGLVLDDVPLEKNTYAPGRAQAPYLAEAGTGNVEGRIVKNAWLLTTKEKNTKSGLSKIDLISSRLSLPEHTMKEAKIIFKKAMEGNLTVGRDIYSFAYASVYASCLVNQIPKTPLEVVAYTNVSKKKMLRSYSIIRKELQISVSPVDPIDLIPRFGSRLELEQPTISKAIAIIEQIRGTKAYNGRHPQTLAAASLYLACSMQGEKRTQREIANTVGVIEVTIRKRSKEIKNCF